MRLNEIKSCVGHASVKKIHNESESLRDRASGSVSFTPPAQARYGRAEPLDAMLNTMMGSPQAQAPLQRYWASLNQSTKLNNFDRAVQDFVVNHAPTGQGAYGAAFAGAAFVPMGIVEGLAALAPHGWLYEGDLRRAGLSEACRGCLAAVMGAGHREPPAGARHKLRYLNAPSRAALRASRAQADYRRAMPALHDIADRFFAEQPFKGYSVALSQHLFPSNREMLKVLEGLGCDRRYAHVLAKKTSLNEEVYDDLVSEGWQITPQVRQTSEQEMLNAANTLRQLLKAAPGRRVLVVDEGAKLVRAIHRSPDLMAQKDRFVCVEQTESGIASIEAMAAAGQPLMVPVWNVARSDLKKHWEAPFIGEDIVRCAMQNLSAIDPALCPKAATILGYGAVGTEVARALKRRGFEVGVFDIDPLRNQAARDDGFAVGERDVLLKNGPMVFGCANIASGAEPALTRQQMQDWLPDGSILVNAGSGNYQWGLPEYAARSSQSDEDICLDQGIRKAAWQGRTVKLGSALDDYPHRVMRLGERHVLLSDSGFVVNRTTDVPAEYIDLTRALMTLGCALAAGQPGAAPGLHEVDPALQQRILHAVSSHLGETGLSLEDPDLSALPSPPSRHVVPTEDKRATWEQRLAHQSVGASSRNS